MMGSIGDGQGPLRRPSSVSWPGDAEVMCPSTVRHDATRGEMGGFNRRVDPHLHEYTQPEPALLARIELARRHVALGDETARVAQPVDVSPVSSGPSPAFGPAVVHPDDDHAYTDPRLLPIALAIAALITAAVVLWASVA